MADRPKRSVVLVDDHDLVRLGLTRAFERADDFEIAGQAGSLAEARSVVHATEPTVVVTDIRLADGSGLEFVSELRSASPDLGIVVVTMYGGDDRLIAAMRAGASAFVSKEAPADHVVTAARQAAVAPRSFTAAGLSAALQRITDEPNISLSPRETEVLELLSKGLGVPAIARRLFVSESTAKTHITKIYDKLGAANRAQAIMNAVRAGLLARE